MIRGTAEQRRSNVGHRFACIVGHAFVVGAALAVSMVGSSRRASANPVDTYGFAARGQAMSGAQTAAVRDAGALYYNPAALAGFETIRIELGVQSAWPELKMNDGNQNVDASQALTAALVVPGTLGPVRLAFGVAALLPNERLSRSRTLAPGQPRWALYDNRPQRLFLASCLAIQIGSRVFLGAGLSYMSRTTGDFGLEGRVGFPDATDSELIAALQVDLRTVRTPVAGILVRVKPWLDIGLAFRGEFVLELDQSFRVQGDVGSPNGMPLVEDGFLALDSAAQDLFQPLQLALGAAAHGESWQLALDFVWQRWSAFENPSARLLLEYDLGRFNDQVDVPDRPMPPDPEFHDTLAIRVGGELRTLSTSHVDLLVRGGAGYEPSPAPEQRGAMNFVDGNRVSLSLGLGATLRDWTELLPRPVDVDLFGALSLLPSRRHVKDSPVDPVGDYVSRGHIWQVGLGTRWQF